MGNKRARPAAKAVPKASKAVALEELDADAFMRGDFLDEHTAESSGDDSAADGEAEAEDSSASEGDDDDDDGAPGALGADSDSDSDNEDDAASHAAQLRALSEKDPEFFEYLQGEEPDLLAFDPAELEVRHCAIPAQKHEHQHVICTQLFVRMPCVLTILTHAAYCFMTNNTGLRQRGGG
jgi:hypothetical protein